MNNTTTEFVMTIEDYKMCYSDMHKEAYGHRPRFMPEMSVEEWEVEFDMLHQRINENYTAQLFSEAQAINDFEAWVAKLIQQGAADREMALRWIRDAHQVHDGDDEYLAYQLGLPYGYFR